MTAAPAKILVVDDDEFVTQTFARILQLDGYQVRMALNAERGLDEVDRERPDAIILDLRMPLVDGLAFLHRLRARKDLRGTRVAIVTGDYFLTDLLVEEITGLGAQLYFKPVWLDDLLGIAQHLLAREHGSPVSPAAQMVQH